ncbi:MAG TPA: ATPase, T2SS/T4P/T4SS family [Alphaproteobacteria bacterium]|nr:ATPase, T2SS/T4P/T4SS family [Alphaproteobacteria bacterium]
MSAAAPSVFRDLAITDLYIRLDGSAQAIYQRQKRGRERSNAVVPDRYEKEIRQIAEFIRNQGLKEDSVLHVNGVRLRLARQKMADGEDWICLRVIKTQIPNLDKLGILPAYAGALRDLGHRDGLIMLTGATGHGKTTTAVALLAEYLKHHGGIAVTIEDPVEYVLKGRHEKGHCFQVEVSDDEEWAGAIKRSLRWAPHYLFVGEIRTPQAAEQVLRAATTGHLVMTTVHAGSPEEALMGLMHLAEQAMGGGSQLILAAGLTAVAHQQMTETGPHMRMVVTEPNNMGDPVRALIRENRVGMINTYIDKATARLNLGERDLRAVKRPVSS